MRGAYATLTDRGGSLELRSSYSPELVAELKACIPAGMRRFDPATKAWLLSPACAAKVAAIVKLHLGVCLQVPATASIVPATVTRLVQLEYLGAAKDRGDGAMSSMGFDGTDWALVFPLGVLKRWFCEDSKPDEAPTLYSALGIRSDADVECVRVAYRRAARQWHPDVCHEPDAKEQFQRIQRAYEVIRDANMRARYDAGLKLTRATGRQPDAFENAVIWKPPLRCGLLLVEGTEQLGRIVVGRIIEWRDVTNPAGQVLVTSWPMGATQPTRRYV